MDGKLESGGQTVLNIPLNPAIDLGKIGVDFSVNLSGDQIQTNNTLTGYYLVNKPETAFFNYDFETSGHNLLAASDNNSTSIWERTQPSGTVLNSVSSGTYAYVTNPSGDYRNDDKDYLYLPCLDFSQVQTAQIQFDLAYDIENEWDALYVEYSTDGIVWQILGTDADPAWYNNSTVNGVCRGAQWTGTNATMQTYGHSLDFLAGEPQVYLRFVMASDAYVTGEGAVIDDLQISGQMSVHNTVNRNQLKIYPNPAGSYMFLENQTDYPVESVKIYSASGQLIRSQNGMNQREKNAFSVDISGLTPGFYFLKVLVNDQQVSLPFVKK